MYNYLVHSYLVYINNTKNWIISIKLPAWIYEIFFIDDRRNDTASLVEFWTVSSSVDPDAYGDKGLQFELFSQLVLKQ